jgi:hypothetical protein
VGTHQETSTYYSKKEPISRVPVSLNPIANPSTTHNSNISNSRGGSAHHHNPNKDTFFPARLHKVITEVDGAIKWLPNGKAFMITDKNLFSEQILPAYFGASIKFNSFTRKLSRWKFKRVRHGALQGAYYHEKFDRDNKLLCLDMNCKNEISTMFSNYQQQQVQTPNYTYSHNISMPNVALGRGYDLRHDASLHPLYYVINDLSTSRGHVNPLPIANLTETGMIPSTILETQNYSNKQILEQQKIIQHYQQQQWMNIHQHWHSSEGPYDSAYQMNIQTMQRMQNDNDIMRRVQQLQEQLQKHRKSYHQP